MMLNKTKDGTVTRAGLPGPALKALNVAKHLPTGAADRKQIPVATGFID